ncbi:MAG: MFS transporter [Nakamurella sp.]
MLTNSSPQLSPQSRVFALSTLLGVLFLTFLDTTIVTVVLGDIQFDLGAGVIPLQWVVNAYALPFAALMLFAGSLGDRIGRQKLMVAGIIVFCAGSVMCAVAPGIGMLIAGRAVMGVGAAASEPGTLSIIRQLYPDAKRRAKAIGGWAAVSGISLALGPVIGGLLAAAGDWRAIFWFNVGLGLVLLVLAVATVPDSHDKQPGRLDVGGLVCGALALGALIFAGMTGEQYGYRTPWVLMLFAVGIVAAAALVVVEKRAASPIVDMKLLARRPVGDALFAAFAIYFGIFSIFFFTALYLDLVEGYTGLDFARLFGAMAAAIVVGGLVAGGWVGRGSTRAPMVTGALISAAGILATRVFLDATPGFVELAASLAVAGLGFGLAIVPVTSAVLTNVPGDHSGMAAGATNTARQLGAVVGVTVLGALVSAAMTRGLSADLDSSPLLSRVKDVILGAFKTGGDQAKGLDFAHPDPLMAPFVESTAAAFRSGIHLALTVSAVLIIVSAAMTMFSVRPRSDRSDTDEDGSVNPSHTSAPNAE